MKHKLLVYILVFFSMAGCDMAGQLGEQLSFLMKIRKQFGGSWKGSYTSGDCYQLEITNSPRINNNQDSLDYYATIIGRELIENFGSKYTCMTLDIVNQKKVAIVTNTTSSQYDYDLQLMKKFKDRTITDYLIIEKALQVMQNAEAGNLEEASKWLKRLEDHQDMPFVKLAEASIAYARENKNTAYQIVAEISRNLQDDMLSFYLGGFFIMDNQPEKALEYFHLATRLNRNNPEHWLNLGELYWIDQKLDSSVYFISRAIDLDSSYLRAFYRRAQVNFKLKQNERACEDISYILALEPAAPLPDSIRSICDQNNN